MSGVLGNFRRDFGDGMSLECELQPALLVTYGMGYNPHPTPPHPPPQHPTPPHTTPHPHHPPWAPDQGWWGENIIFGPQGTRTWGSGPTWPREVRRATLGWPLGDLHVRCRRLPLKQTGVSTPSGRLGQHTQIPRAPRPRWPSLVELAPTLEIVYQGWSPKG